MLSKERIVLMCPRVHRGVLRHEMRQPSATWPGSTCGRDGAHVVHGDPAAAVRAFAFHLLDRPGARGFLRSGRRATDLAGRSFLVLISF